MTKCPFPHTECKGWLKSQEQKEFTLQAYQRQTANPSFLGDRKQAGQEGQHTLFPTLLQQIGQARDHFLLPSQLISCTSALSQQNQRESEGCWLSVRVNMYNSVKRMGELMRSSGTKAKTSHWLFIWDTPRTHWGIDLTCSVFNVEFEPVGQWIATTAVKTIKLNAQHQKWTLIQPFPAKLPASWCF